MAAYLCTAFGAGGFAALLALALREAMYQLDSASLGAGAVVTALAAGAALGFAWMLRLGRFAAATSAGEEVSSIAPAVSAALFAALGILGGLVGVFAANAEGLRAAIAAQLLLPPPAAAALRVAPLIALLLLVGGVCAALQQSLATWVRSTAGPLAAWRFLLNALLLAAMVIGAFALVLLALHDNGYSPRIVGLAAGALPLAAAYVSLRAPRRAGVPRSPRRERLARPDSPLDVVAVIAVGLAVGCAIPALVAGGVWAVLGAYLTLMAMVGGAAIVARGTKWRRIAKSWAPFAILPWTPCLIAVSLAPAIAIALLTIHERVWARCEAGARGGAARALFGVWLWLAVGIGGAGTAALGVVLPQAHVLLIVCIALATLSILVLMPRLPVSRLGLAGFATACLAFAGLIRLIDANAERVFAQPAAADGVIDERRSSATPLSLAAGTDEHVAIVTAREMPGAALQLIDRDGPRRDLIIIELENPPGDLSRLACRRAIRRCRSALVEGGRLALRLPAGRLAAEALRLASRSAPAALVRIERSAGLPAEYLLIGRDSAAWLARRAEIHALRYAICPVVDESDLERQRRRLAARP